MALRALTLWQPMAWAISDYTKRVENRPWKPWKGIREIAIHAGLTYHAPHAEQIADAFGVEVPKRDAVPQGAIVAVALVAGYICEEDEGAPELTDPWFSGPYGWLLENVRKLSPVPCRGAQGLWSVPPAIETQIRLHLQE